MRTVRILTALFGLLFLAGTAEAQDGSEAERQRIAAGLAELGIDPADPSIDAALDQFFADPERIPDGTPLAGLEWMWLLVIEPDGTQTRGLGVVLWDIVDGDSGPMLTMTALSVDPATSFEIFFIDDRDDTGDLLLAVRLGTETNSETATGATLAFAGVDLNSLDEIEATPLPVNELAFAFAIPFDDLLGKGGAMLGAETIMLATVFDTGAHSAAAMHFGDSGAARLSEVLAAWRAD